MLFEKCKTKTNIIIRYNMIVLLLEYIITHSFKYNSFYCILCGQIKGFNSSITAIMCQVGSYRTVVGSYRMVE